MTLGELIKALEAADPELVVPHGFGDPDSYRGYYEDLAFAPRENVTVRQMLDDARRAVGVTFHGWKGGEYTMSEHTDCWLAERGDTGETIGPVLLGYMLAPPAALTVTPAGYQGPAQPTWTAGCAGFHEPGPCPLPPLPPKWAPADWGVMLGQLHALAAKWEAEADDAKPDAADMSTAVSRRAAVRQKRICRRQLLEALGQPS